MLVIGRNVRDKALEIDPSNTRANAIVKVDGPSIAKYETAMTYRDASLAIAYRVSLMCEHAEGRRTEGNQSIVEFFKRKWESQEIRARECNSVVDTFITLDGPNHNYGQGTTAQEWRAHFDVVVNRLEIWVERMKEILANREPKRFFADEEALVPRSLGRVLDQKSRFFGVEAAAVPILPKALNLSARTVSVHSGGYLWNTFTL